MKFQIEVLKSKIHRVSVTQADLNYVGSITIDEELMDAANMIEGEKVQVLDVDNGERLETYIIKGERGSGAICLRLRVPERRRGTQGAGGRRRNHRLLRPAGFRRSQSLQALGDIPGYENQQADPVENSGKRSKILPRNGRIFSYAVRTVKNAPKYLVTQSITHIFA